MEKTILEKYEVTDLDEVIIDISIKTEEDLYNKFDRKASDIHDSLNHEFVDYIIESVGEIGDNNFIIRLTLSNIPDQKVTSHIQSSIQKHFLQLKELENHSIEAMFSRVFKLFGLGLALMFVAIVFNRYISPGEGTLAQIIYEGLTISAWISLWTAILTLIIKWPPKTKNVKLYERIIKAKIIFRHQLPESNVSNNETLPES